MSLDALHEARFTAWFSNHGGIAQKIARAYAEGPADRADLKQELWLQLWRSVPNYREEAKASTWIYRVCLNTAMTWRRNNVRRRHGVEQRSDFSEVMADGSSPAEHAAERELLQRLYTAIHAMDEFEKALVLLMLDGLSYREMAEVTGLTENHVGVALTRARKRLAKLMSGGTDELE